LDFPQELPGSVHNKIEGPLGQIRPIRSFAIRQSVAGSSQRGRVCARPDPAGPGGRQEIVASGERIVASEAGGRKLAVIEKRQTKPIARGVNQWNIVT